MGFFNKPGLGGSALEALSVDRIKQALEDRSWKYQVDDDGDVVGGWDDGYFYFFTRGEAGEILYVRGTWYGKLDPSQLDAAQATVAEWNQERFWPKVYARLDEEENVVRLHAEHTVDYEHGLTDEQLQQHLVTIVNTGGQFFEHASETFPEAATAFKEESPS